jgi:hypothetical protein
MVRRTSKLILSIIIILLCQSCKGKNDGKRLQSYYDSLSIVQKYDKFYDENFQDEPKFLIDTSYFTIPIKDLTKYPGWTEEFRINGFFGNHLYSKWKRTYQGKGTYLEEYRGYDGLESYEYIFVICVDIQRAVYIKWTNAVQADGIKPSKLGPKTNYVESNLPKEILLKLYPSITCDIHIKYPRLIRMHFGDFNPRLIYNDEKCWPWKYNNIRPDILF